ncbi:hypothetical protein GGR54DRAFT_594935 [Hypoxylon sp. NC1633]|nr:hypothetical protein GGR54DRAFT_594935 [Hypoxylon sp. NC1633]
MRTKSGSFEGNSVETKWLLDDEDDEDDIATSGVGSELSPHELQIGKGLFTYFDDPDPSDPTPPSPSQSPLLLPPDQQFSQESVALLDYPYAATNNAACEVEVDVEKRTYTCFYLTAAALALLFASLALSLWWSINHDDVSGGFGMGSYMLAMSSVIIAVASYMHRSSCRCWNRQNISPS